MPVIVFFGPDGAGKSTQVRLLKKSLQENGMKTRTAWIRALHTFAFVIDRFLIGSGYCKVKLNPYGRGHSAPDFGRIPGLRKIWPVIELFSAAPLIVLRVKVPSLLGQIVVCERYTVDSVASIAYLTEDQGFPKRFIARVFFAMISPDYLCVNLDCDYETLVSRRGNLVEPEEFIRIQQAIYSQAERLFNALHVDTSKLGVEETRIIIKDFVMKSLGTEDLQPHRERYYSNEVLAKSARPDLTGPLLSVEPDRKESKAQGVNVAFLFD